jgi:hypothetical protein
MGCISQEKMRRIEKLRISQLEIKNHSENSANSTNNAHATAGDPIIPVDNDLSTSSTKGMENTRQAVTECDCPADQMLQTITQECPAALELLVSTQESTLPPQTSDTEQEGVRTPETHTNTPECLEVTRIIVEEEERSAAIGIPEVESKSSTVVKLSGAERTCPVASESRIMQHSLTDDSHESYPGSDTPSNNNMTSSDVTAKNVKAPNMTSPPHIDVFPHINSLHINGHGSYDNTMVTKQSRSEGDMRRDDLNHGVRLDLK